MDIETLANKKIDLADVSKVSLRDMYMRICECRDFEISHVWQRAIFLTAFLLGCFTAYGAVCSLMLDEHHKFAYSWYVNFSAFSVSLVGVVVSLFWIMMAKGSKAWYELYESAIGAFSVKYPDGCDLGVAMLSQHNWRKLICEAHAIDDKVKEESRAGCIFSLKGGPYSVSKINVGIGILSFVIWAALAVVHIIVAVRYSAADFNAALSTIKDAVTSPTGMLVALLLVVVGLPLAFAQLFKSGCLSKSAWQVAKGK